MITLLNKFDDKYIISEKDILGIVLSYIELNGLDNYFKDIVFSSNSKFMGYYNTKTNEVVLNDDKIMKFCYRLYDRLVKTCKVDEEYYTYFINFYYLYIIYHELTHVSQKAKYEKEINDNSLFNYLYEVCFKIREENNSLYGKYHNLFPMEIDANNNGFLTAYNLMQYTKLPGKECKIMHSQYLNSTSLNYEKVSDNRILTPIEKLAMETKCIDLDKVYELLENEKLSKLTRLNLGLPITEKEYDNIEKEKVKLLKHF